MKGIRKNRPSPAMVVALLSLFVALSGTAWAASSLPANSVTSGNIVNGQVKSADLRANAVNSAKVANGSLTGADILESSLDSKVLQSRVKGACAPGTAMELIAPKGAVGCGVTNGGTPGGAAGGDLTGSYPSPAIADNSVTGAKVADGSIATDDLAPSALSARAYGLVSGTTVTRSKNIAGVTNPGAGTFCVSLAAGIDPLSTGAVVMPDFVGDDTFFGTDASQSFAEWRSVPDLQCPIATTLEIVTGKRTDTTAPDPQGGATFVTHVTNTQINEPFFIVVP
jgi:hypothetical protein